jgi:hypothetical protein
MAGPRGSDGQHHEPTKTRDVPKPKTRCGTPTARLRAGSRRSQPYPQCMWEECQAATAREGKRPDHPRVGSGALSRDPGGRTQPRRSSLSSGGQAETNHARTEANPIARTWARLPSAKPPPPAVILRTANPNLYGRSTKPTRERGSHPDRAAEVPKPRPPRIRNSPTPRGVSRAESAKAVEYC